MIKTISEKDLTLYRQRLVSDFKQSYEYHIDMLWFEMIERQRIAVTELVNKLDSFKFLNAVSKITSPDFDQKQTWICLQKNELQYLIILFSSEYPDDDKVKTEPVDNLLSIHCWKYIEKCREIDMDDFENPKLTCLIFEGIGNNSLIELLQILEKLDSD